MSTQPQSEDIFDHYDRESLENVTEDDFFDPFDVYEDDDFSHSDYSDDDSLV